MTWVDVNNRLPNEGGIVWCSYISKRGIEVDIGHFYNKKFYNAWTNAEIPVLFWKPYYTPKPPKSKSLLK